MKPYGNFDLCRRARKRSDGIEEGKAFKQMLLRVIVTVSFGVAADEFIADVLAFAQSTEFRPGPPPRRFKCGMKAS